MNQRPEYDAKQTGRNLRRLRLEHGYTAEQVREYIGMGSVQAVYKWERGECFPALDNFFALVELYGEKPLDILVRSREENGFTLEWESCEPVRSRHLFQYWIQCGQRMEQKKNNEPDG